MKTKAMPAEAPALVPLLHAGVPALVTVLLAGVHDEVPLLPAGLPAGVNHGEDLGPGLQLLAA